MSAADGFGPDHLPVGVFRPGPDATWRVGARLGTGVVDLAALADAERRTEWAGWFAASSINRLLEQPAAAWAQVRDWLRTRVDENSGDPTALPRHELADVEVKLAVDVADYVDFYANPNHAANVGALFRPGQDPLTPNYKHLPIGYTGRSGTVVVSGADIVRPSGQRKPPDADTPVFGPSVRLDIEAELGFVLGNPTRLGDPVAMAEAGDHIFGVALFNDWSARDIQAWEYVPLGPHLGKSFASSLAAWITPMAALEAARIPLPDQEPEVSDYLSGTSLRGLDIDCEVWLNDELIARPPYSSMYWSPEQFVAHLTVNGASIRAGDLLGSGTISGAEPDQRGSLLELAWGGADPITLSDGSTRSFLEDGDLVVLRATAPGTDGNRIRLAEVEGRIRPARG